MLRAGLVRDGLVGLAVFVALAIAYRIIPDPGIHDIIIKTCIFSIFALSLNLLIGYLGLVSFGHAAFFAAGAYVFGLFMQSRMVTIDTAWAVPVGLVLGILVSAVLAAAIGAICVRARTIYFSFLTLAFQMVLYNAILAAVPITGGDQGLMGGFPKPEFLGIDLTDAGHMYLFCAGIAIVCALVLRQVVESPFGYALRMMRDNPDRAAFLGLKVKLYQWIAFVIAGAMASVAGMLQTLLDIGAFPEWAFWAKSAEPLFMILLGGMQTFLGPVVGAFIFEILNAVVTSHPRFYGLVLGAVILFFAIGLRRGLVDFVWQALRKRASEKGADA